MRSSIEINRAFATLMLVVSTLAMVASAQVPQSITHDTPAGRVPVRGLESPSVAKPIKAGALEPRGVDAAALEAEGAAGTTLPNWSGVSSDDGNVYSYTMLGTNPALGSQTTTISAVLIPLKLVFSDGTVLDATAPVFGESDSALLLTRQSPLFQSVAFKPGGTNVGSTQYIDAFQRANFWNIVNLGAPGFHLKFKVTTEPVQTLTVPAYFGSTQSGTGDRVGFVDQGWWDGELGVLLYRLKIKTSTLPIFLNYNILQTSSDFTYAGYHTAFGNPTQVYISAGFFDQGLFSYGGDIVFLSHEMGESTDDPFVNNIVPPWNNPQSPGTCSNLLEVGDPVSDLGIGVYVVKGYSYHPEDLTFLPWFFGETPSTSVNGWYTFGNNYTGPSTCTD